MSGENRKLDTSFRKKRKLDISDINENKLRDGISTPSPIVRLIKPQYGCISFMVPSKKRSLKYTTTVTVENNSLKFACDCSKPNKTHCKHIIYTILYLMHDIIKKDDRDISDILSQIKL